MAILDYEAFGLAVKDVGYFFVLENVTGDACDLSGEIFRVGCCYLDSL